MGSGIPPWLRGPGFNLAPGASQGSGSPAALFFETGFLGGRSVVTGTNHEISAFFCFVFFFRPESSCNSSPLLNIGIANILSSLKQSVISALVMLLLCFVIYLMRFISCGAQGCNSQMKMLFAPSCPPVIPAHWTDIMVLELIFHIWIRALISEDLFFFFFLNFPCKRRTRATRTV